MGAGSDETTSVASLIFVKSPKIGKKLYIWLQY